MNTLSFIASILTDITILVVVCLILKAFKRPAQDTTCGVDYKETTPVVEKKPEETKSEKDSVPVVKSMDAVIQAANALMGIGSEEEDDGQE